ncbi:uncharacterized protein LOC132066825 [Lycium ferocissimum]|uniref:uncharacterized protein LOC132066825 n=1 Tax=Lycium ferocissimum TaxID=112874 RepID=UPI002816144A|nr:uncharacterized protein LOC132066825 [Lycium ferocissimum]
MNNLRMVFGFAIFFMMVANHVIAANISDSKISCKTLCRLTCILSAQPVICNHACTKRCTIPRIYQAMTHNTSCYENCANVNTDEKKMEGCFDDCTTKYYKSKRSIVN